jgi:hypothetical protein
MDLVHMPLVRVGRAAMPRQRPVVRWGAAKWRVAGLGRERPTPERCGNRGHRGGTQPAGAGRLVAARPARSSERVTGAERRRGAVDWGRNASWLTGGPCGVAGNRRYGSGWRVRPVK